MTIALQGRQNGALQMARHRRQYLCGFRGMSYRLGNIKTELIVISDIELAWIKKTRGTRNWSNCTRGESKS